MSKGVEVIGNLLGGDTIYVSKSGIVEGGVYIETRGETDAGFTMSATELLQALHNLGIDVQGWKPRATLHDLLVDLLAVTVDVNQPERAERIIELVQGFKP